MKTALRRVKEAVFAKIVSDAPLMSKLARPPIVEAIPLNTNFGKKAVVQYVGTASVGAGSKEFHIITLNIISYSHDLNEDIAFDIERLLHSAGRRFWRKLNLGDGQHAYIRRESVSDFYSDDNRLHIKTIQFRVLYGPALVA